MKTAVIYARYSCDNQTEQSIDGQLRVCEEYAKRNNILILDTYIDRAMTGTNDNRPDFQRMIQDSNRKEWNFVLVYKLDRFSRNKYESIIHKRTLKTNGVKVLSAMENIPDTPEGIILESLLEGMNQYFSAELAQKVSRGMRETRKKGYFQGGTLLYGYKLDGKHIIIDEDQAEVVRYVYEQYSRNVYVKDILAHLTQNGITKNGKPFAINSIYLILKNEKYSGVYKHGDEIIDNMYPQIVPQELFDIVRAKINANKYGKNSLAVEYLLKKKLKCGYCGQSVIGENGTSKNGERKYYYKCRGRKMRLNDCQKSMFRKEELERLILDNIVQELSKPEIMEDIIRSLIKIQEETAKINLTLSLLQKEQKQVTTALDNIMTAIEKGVMNKTTNKRMQELEARQEELERLILIERSKQTVKVPESEIRAFYEQALRLEAKLLIDCLIKEIVLYDDKIEIFYNSPIRTSPDESRGFSFFSKEIKIDNSEITLVMSIK